MNAIPETQRLWFVVLVAALAGGLAVFPLSARAETKAEIKIDNFTFVPQVLTVARGTSVTWTNRDDIPHTVVEKSNSFRSRALDTGDSYSFTFNQPGSYDYFCGLHPHMTGKIIVTP